MELLSCATTPRKSVRPKSSTPGLRQASNNYSSPVMKLEKPPSSNVKIMTPTTTISSSCKTGSDRFIPNRNNIDFDYCNHTLLSSDMCAGKEDLKDETTQDTTRAVNQKIVNEFLNITNQTPGKRLVDCFERKHTITQTPAASVVVSVSLCTQHHHRK
jgi:hypothetical protein